MTFLGSFVVNEIFFQDFALVSANELLRNAFLLWLLATCPHRLLFLAHLYWAIQFHIIRPHLNLLGVLQH